MKWLELNNQVIIRDNEGKLQLGKDKESLNSYMEDYVDKKSKKFDNIISKINFLVENNYYDKEIIGRYSNDFIEKLHHKLN